MRRVSAALLIALISAVGVLSGVVIVSAIGSNCRYARSSYDALHKVIVKSYTPSRPSPSLLEAFPQLRPFYTPGNPQYEEQIRASEARRDEVLDVLGDRPTC